MFRIGVNTILVPELDNKTKGIYNKIKTNFPYIKYCIWDTSVLNKLSLHLSNKSFILVEVEKEASESVFYWLKEQKFKVFYNPNIDILEEYIYSISKPIIVKSLISEAPLQNKDKYNTVTIEKILVDLICDKDLFNFYQGIEKTHIFKNAYNKYTINNDRLFRYASRRGIKEEIEYFVNKIIGNIY